MSATEVAFSDLEVTIPFSEGRLRGQLSLPPEARGVIVFAHGSGSSRFSPRNRAVARTLQERGFGTLLFDLLTREEEVADMHTGMLRFDIGLLAERLVFASEWLHAESPAHLLELGYFGASTGAAAAIVAATHAGLKVSAVVSRGGRPDLAGDYLEKLQTPTLLIVGGEDRAVLALNEQALARMHCVRELQIIPNATHLFEEPGTLDQAAALAGQWFEEHVGREAKQHGEPSS